MTELPDGPLETWYDVHAVHDGIVDYAFCYRFPSGELVGEAGALMFRLHAAVVNDLVAARLDVEVAYGDWDRRPVSDDSPE